MPFFIDHLNENSRSDFPNYLKSRDLRLLDFDYYDRLRGAIDYTCIDHCAFIACVY